MSGKAAVQLTAQGPSSRSSTAQRSCSGLTLRSVGGADCQLPASKLPAPRIRLDLAAPLRAADPPRAARGPGGIPMVRRTLASFAVASILVAGPALAEDLTVVSKTTVGGKTTTSTQY